MNIRSALAAAALTLAGTAVFAAEATSFDIPAGTLTRAEVKAELARAQADHRIGAPSALYGDVTPTIASVRSRAEVRSEAVQAMRDHLYQSLYLGA